MSIIKHYDIEIDELKDKSDLKASENLAILSKILDI